jgi:predicted Zn-dependent protease
MNIQELEKQIDEGYKVLIVTTDRYRQVAEKVRSREAELERLILDAYAQDKIAGKNATERKASEQAVFGADVLEIDDLKAQEAEAYRKKELAEIDVSRLRAILRIQELCHD